MYQIKSYGEITKIGHFLSRYNLYHFSMSHASPITYITSPNPFSPTPYWVNQIKTYGEIKINIYLFFRKLLYLFICHTPKKIEAILSKIEVLVLVGYHPERKSSKNLAEKCDKSPFF